MKFKMESLDSRIGFSCFKCNKEPHFSMSIKGESMDTKVKICIPCSIKVLQEGIADLTKESK